MTKIEQAQEFAHEAHDRIKQVRKYSGEPYWVHTDAVAATVRAVVGSTDDMVIAAHLHDILEDVTPKYPAYSEGQIEVLFGKPVLLMVKELTDVFTKEAYPDWNRAKRHSMENERIGTIQPQSKTIKLADLIDNTKSIVANDADFARVYLREKLNLLGFLSEGDSGLLQQASIQTITGFATLGMAIPTLS